MLINEVIKLKPKSKKALDWIEKIYSQFPVMPSNNKQRAMVFGQGEDQALGVFELAPSMLVPDAVEIVWFQAYPTNSGIGKIAMQKLQDLASQDDITLTLYPWGKGVVPKSKLKKFYTAMGFKPLHKADMMIWSPEQITETMQFDTKRKKNSFALDLIIDGEPVGTFQYNQRTGRTLVELDPLFQGKGLGKLLILQGIYTAAKLGMEYIEDESRTAAFDNAMDSLADSGFIVNDDEYWYVTDIGEKYLQNKADMMTRTPDQLSEVTRITIGKDEWGTLGSWGKSSGRPEKIRRLPVNKIKVHEPDTKFDDPVYRQHLERVKAALRRGEKIEPITVRRMPGELLRYQVLDGHHRFKAYRDLGLKEIPAQIVHKFNITDLGTEKLDENVEANPKFVYRIDSTKISDFGKNLRKYKHTADWSTSGLDQGDDWWNERGIKPETSSGIFAGTLHQVAPYATGNANQTRFVVAIRNNQKPILYFDIKDVPVFKNRKTYLTKFNGENFKLTPTEVGEYFSERPGNPVEQIEITNPFEFIRKQGWDIKLTKDLEKELEEIKKEKNVTWRAEGMN